VAEAAVFIKQFDEGPSQLAGQSLTRRNRELSPFLLDSQKPELLPFLHSDSRPERSPFLSASHEPELLPFLRGGRRPERPSFLPASHEPEPPPFLPMSGGPDRLLRDGRLAERVTERAARDDVREQSHHEAAGLLQEVGSLLEVADPLVEALGSLLDPIDLLQEVSSLLQTAAELAGSVGPGVIFESIMALACSTGYTGQSRLVTLGAEKARLETGLQFAKGDCQEIGKAVLAAGRGDRSLFPNLYSLGRAVAETTTIQAQLSQLGVEHTMALLETRCVGGFVSKSTKR
jgi:hypothetical protein